MPPTGPPRPEYDQKPYMGQDSGPQKAQQAHRQSSVKLGPQACSSEEFEWEEAAELINRCGALSTSEVGLNSHHHAAVQGHWSRLVARTGTNSTLWSWLVPRTGTNEAVAPRAPLVPVRGTNRYQSFLLAKQFLVPPRQLRGTRSGL